MGLRRTLFCIAMCLFGALPASAFMVRHDTGGHVLRWPASAIPVRYQIGLSGSAEADAALAGAVVRAFEAWNHAPGSYFRFRYAGRTRATRATPDGENSVIWVTRNWPHKPETIAYTTVWVDALGRILDADVELNAELFTWSPGRMPGMVDVQDAVAHEGGHVVGLAHSLESTDTTMFPILMLGEVLKRSLEPDDVAGLRALYPVLASQLVLYDPVEAPPAGLRPAIEGLLADQDGGAPTVVLRTDADGDGADEIGVFRAAADPAHGRPSFSIIKPNPGGTGALLVAYDEWQIPAGGEVEDAAALDTDGDGFEELVVLKNDPDLGGQEVLVYPMPTWGALREASARPAVARDAWRIPAGGTVLALFALRRPGGGSLGVVRATAGGALELDLMSPPRPGDTTEADAARGESTAVLLPDDFAMTDIDAADLDGDGADEVIVLDQDGANATVRAYDVVTHPDGLALTLALRWSLPLDLPAQERALGVIGVDLDGLGLDQLGIRHATIR